MAQEIRGVVTDIHKEPIEGVAVMFQTTDSLYVDAVVTDSTGSYHWHNDSGDSRLILFQHLLYETQYHRLTEGSLDVVLAEKSYLIDEIAVVAERPLVKVIEGRLTYDVPQLMKNKTGTTAFDVLKELPGVLAKDEGVELVGARSLQVILNGQLTTLTNEQLIQLLKTMPASRVLAAEVMYNAPARYNTRGAVINIQLDNQQAESPYWQGEAGVAYKQQHYANGEAHLNLLYGSPKLNVDLLVNGGTRSRWSGEDLLARHTLHNEITTIEQINRRESEGWGGATRLGIDYTFDNKDKLSASYYFSGSDIESKGSSLSTFLPEKESQPTINNSTTTVDGMDQLHNAHLQYDGHQGITAGIDYTAYHDPSDLFFHDNSSSGASTSLYQPSKQDIGRWSLFANHSFERNGWGWNWGVNGTTTSSKNRIETFYGNGNSYLPAPAEEIRNDQREYSGNLFAEVTKSFNSRFSATAGLKTEYFRSDYESPEEKMTLWNEWTLFPTLSLNYMFSPSHILQMHVNSDKTYPSFWSLSPKEVPLNSYSYIVGNPQLKPYRSYETQLMYILKQKYIFIASWNYEPDLFTQLSYQSDTEMKNIFRFDNLDYGQEFGLAMVLPFRIGSFWSTRLTLKGNYMQQKSSDFHGMSFNRDAFYGIVATNNSFNVSDKPNIKLTLNAHYVTPGAVQGLLDLGYMYNVSAGAKYTFAHDKAILALDAENIFHSNYPNKIETDFGTQWSRMKMVSDNYYVKLSFTYKFGGYKKREHNEVDRSRFGQ